MCNGVGQINAGKLGTAVKGARLYCRNAGAYVYLGQAASIEGSAADVGHGVGDSKSSQIAGRKGIMTDRPEAGGKAHLYQV